MATIAEQTSFPIKASVNLQEAIGARLYPDPAIAVVELVSNSFDADATKVMVTVEPDKITVRDNGFSMNRRRLVNYFTLGLSTKLPSRLGREPIGQFGVGKFAILSMASSFEVEAKCNGFHGQVLYDQKAIAEQGEFLNDSTLPLVVFEEQTESLTDEYVTSFVPGESETYTEIRMNNLRRAYDETRVKQKIIENIAPGTVGDFEVYVNGEKLEDRYIHGLRYPVNLEVEGYGPITGEIIWAARSVILGNYTGAQVVVNSRAIGRWTFGIQDVDADAAARISGSITANWLNDIITTDRTGFITDDPKWIAFKAAMNEFLVLVVEEQQLRRKEDRRRRQQAALNRAVRQVTDVLRHFPEFNFPQRALESTMSVRSDDIILKGTMSAAKEDGNAEIRAKITSKKQLDEFQEFLNKAEEHLGLEPDRPESNIADLEQGDPENINLSEDVEGDSVLTGQSETDPFGEDIDLVNQPTDEVGELLQRAARILEEEVEELVKGIEGAVSAEADERLLRGAQALAFAKLKKRIEDRITKKIREQKKEAQAKRFETQTAVTIKQPIVGKIQLDNITASQGESDPETPPKEMPNLPEEGNSAPAAPGDADSVKDTQVNPDQTTDDENPPLANIANFIAASVEHLGEEGPASMMAEGFGYDGTMIYINADHSVYSAMDRQSVGFISFYEAQLLFNEVILMQGIEGRSGLERQSEMLSFLLKNDPKILLWSHKTPEQF